MKILGIVGSLRAESFNKKLLQYAATVAEKLGTPIDVVGLEGIPVFNQDDEKAPPAAVTDFRKKIEESDGIVFATPEYNYSIPGVLKNAIDWGSRPPKNVFEDKIVAVMGATPGGLGTVQAQKELRHIMLILNAIVVPRPFVTVSAAHNAFDADGKLTNPQAAESVEKLLKRFFEVTQALTK